MLDKQIFQYLKNDNLLPVIQAGEIGVLGKPASKNFEHLIKQIKSIAAAPVLLLPELGLLSVYMQEVPDIAWDIIEYSEKSLQVIFPNGRSVPPWLLHSDSTISIRVESKGAFHKLLYNMGSPLAFVKLTSNYHKDEEFLTQFDKVLNLPVDFEWKIKPNKVIALGLKGEIKFL